MGDVPTPSDISTTDQTPNFTPFSGFGAGSYSCPNDQAFFLTTFGRSLPVTQWAPVCNFAQMIQPLVVGLAFLSAAFIAFGFSRKE
jgi:hypothetical protein